jgi:hypothetical protein
MARTSQSGVSSPQKNSVKGKGRALHTQGSNRKLTMKYIELDENDSFDRITSDRHVLEPGALYQVSEYDDEEQGFTFTRVKKVLADIELMSEQYQILEKVMELEEIQTVEDFVKLSILYHINAEVDHHFRGQARAKYMKVADDAIKELTAA